MHQIATPPTTTARAQQRLSTDMNPMQISIPRVHDIASSQCRDTGQNGIIKAKAKRGITGKEQSRTEHHGKDRPEAILKLLPVMKPRFFVGNEKVESIGETYQT
eukprot:scaffold6090_cov168-Amphora_coffeaeformis.AAC.5